MPRSRSSCSREREVRRDVDPRQREEREARADEELAGGLAPLAQTHVPAAPNREVVVDETDRGQPDGEHEHGEARARELQLLAAQVGDRVPEDGADDERDATHRGRAGLPGVRMRERPVVADELADATRSKDTDEERRAEHRDRERHPGGDEERDHRATFPRMSASASPSSPTARLAFTRTASPGATRCATAAPASATSATRATSTPARACGLGERVHAVADGNHDVDAERAGELADARVLRLGVWSELPHLAEHRDAPSTDGEAGERAQRRGRRCGARVVRVVDHGDTVGALHDGHAVRLGPRVGEATDRVRERHTQLDRHGGGHRRVHRLVRAAELSASRRRAPRRDRARSAGAARRRAPPARPRRQPATCCRP